MKTPPIVSPEAWEAARLELLVKEKAFTRTRDGLAAERRRMPWMPVEKAYQFEGPKGKASLLDLFEGRRQLIVYRAFFEPGVFGWPDHACRGCSFGADQVSNLAHLNARDTTLAYVSRAPQEDIARLKAQGQEPTQEKTDRLKMEARAFFEMCISDVLQGKIDAAYWLGLIEYELGQYDSAFNYFVARTLQAAGAAVFWESGAHYNMARCYEMIGHWQEAVQEYESNARMQNDAGSLVRARWLKEVHGAKPASEEKKPAPRKANEKKAAA